MLQRERGDDPLELGPGDFKGLISCQMHVVGAGSSATQIARPNKCGQGTAGSGCAGRQAFVASTPSDLEHALELDNVRRPAKPNFAR